MVVPRCKEGFRGASRSETCQRDPSFWRSGRDFFSFFGFLTSDGGFKVWEGLERWGAESWDSSGGAIMKRRRRWYHEEEKATVVSWGGGLIYSDHDRNHSCNLGKHSDYGWNNSSNYRKHSGNDQKHKLGWFVQLFASMYSGIKVSSTVLQRQSAQYDYQNLCDWNWSTSRCVIFSEPYIFFQNI